jgi:hypothetical protein
MFVVIFFLLGLSFGFAARLPWALLAFLVPLGLALTAADRDGGAMVLGFAVTAIGILAGLVLATRTDERHA